MPKLSEKDIDKVLNVLHRRQLKLKDPNYYSVGFGLRNKEGLVDDASKPVVKYFMRRKLQKPRKQLRIPAEVDVRFKTGDKMVSMSFETDVEVLPALSTSGRFLTDFPEEKITSGVIFCWQKKNSQTKWGLLTVGHGFDSHDDVLVTIEFSQQHRATGYVLRDSFRHSQAYRYRVDAAIIMIHENDASRFLRSRGKDPTTSTVSFLKPSELTRSAIGTTLSPYGRQSLQVRGFVINPPSPPIPSLPIKRHFVFAATEHTNTFVPGTSGSVWEINNKAAVLQSGGNRNSDWRVGGGQLLIESVKWVRAVLAPKRLRFIDYF